MGCHFLLQGIFPSQGLNPGLLHCRQILYQLSYEDIAIEHDKDWLEPTGSKMAHDLTSTRPLAPVDLIINMCVHAKSPQSCPTLCDPMNYSPPGSCVHGILQTRILEWVAMPSSRGSSRPRYQSSVS